MKWSSLFSRKRDEVSAESKVGFRLMPYTLAVALILLAVGFAKQPLAQDGDASAETPAAAATSESQTTAQAPELTSPQFTATDTGASETQSDAVTIDPAFITPEGDSDAGGVIQSLIPGSGIQTPVSVEAGPITTSPVDGDAASDTAKGDAETKTDWGTILISVGVFLLILCGSAFLARAAARSWRMPEHAFKFFLILFTGVGSVVATVYSLKEERLTLGIDLSGGVVLIYDVKGHSDSNDPMAAETLVSPQTFDALLESVRNRINPAGIKEIDVRRYGASQLKIVIPHADNAEVQRIEKLISEAGTLEFRILASQSMRSDQALINQARIQSEADPGATNVYMDGVLVAKWVPINPDELSQLVSSPVHVVRQSGTRFEVLVLQDAYNVTGEYLRDIRDGMFSGGRGKSRVPRPGVEFSLDARGTTRFTRLTSEYALGENNPEGTRYLGIIMSGEMHSAPTLEEPITGGGCSITFSPRPGDEGGKQLNEDIKDLLQVMRAGALPANISKQPISRNHMGPTLGDATIRNSQLSAAIAIIGIFSFMIIYYRACGFLACCAVTMNFFLIMTVMLSIRAAFTLPGLAGLVLTLGMAVDANILIFERLREELASGSALRHAIRNAFSRASTAIVDSNLTTLIVAVILYVVGTEQTRSFAVTLFLGVLFTMYTAVFCSHVVFEVLERRGILTKVTMLRILDKPSINFMGLRKTSVTIFATLCVLSLLLAFFRGTNMYDIDFVGGVSVDIAFKKDAEITIPEIETKLVDAGVARPTVSTVYDAVVTESQVESTEQIGQRFTISSATPVGMKAEDYLGQVTKSIAEQFQGQLILDTIRYTLQEQQGITSTETVAQITVYPSMNFKSLDTFLKDYSKQAVDRGDLANPLAFTITNAEVPDAAKTSQSFSNWTVTSVGTQADVEKVLSVFEKEFNATPWFPASNTIGSVVADYAKMASLAAILASFVAIVLYLWLRFHKIYFGLAAVVTLINNVLITLGALALSIWLKPILGFAYVDDFKISLTVVAAFLTVIGYSLNDTIILFDRIREIRGKSSQLTIDHINRSVNQVLSRTLLTSLTTLYVVIVLYIFAGAGLRAFSFALGVGIVAGTLGSIFLASPLLYWMVNQPGKSENGVAKNTKAKVDKYDRKPQ